MAIKSSLKLIKSCMKFLRTEFQYLYGNTCAEYVNLIRQFVDQVLEEFVACDAPYHNLEHTLQVVLVGQSILYGKHLCKEPVSPQDWIHFILSLLCHDIGYVKGACRNDEPEKNKFVTGQGEVITLNTGATGASLTPYHVDRSKLFVAENFGSNPYIEVDIVQHNIELTRFPVPTEDLYQDTIGFAGLARAADLIGQLADPAYLSKLPALFQEFEETGSNKFLGYTNPNELRKGYPRFYWKGVSLYLKHGIRYLEMSKSGQAILANLYNNRVVVEKELDRYYNENNSFLQSGIGWFRRSSLPGF